MKDIKEGMKCTQIKAIEECDFDYVGNEFDITEVADKIIVFQCNLGKGVISRNEFNTYFKLIEEPVDETYITIEGIKVIRNRRITVVILPDGCKGISKCLPEDQYDKDKGFDIAYTKAMIKSFNKQLKKLIE